MRFFQLFSCSLLSPIFIYNMAELFDAIDAWEESTPWHEYRTEILLFCEQTTRDETKVVAHIILRGIKPHQPRWYKVASRMPPEWRVTKKDPTYKNAADPTDENAIKYCTPVERFLAWMDWAHRWNVDAFNCLERERHTIGYIIKIADLRERLLNLLE